MFFNLNVNNIFYKNLSGFSYSNYIRKFSYGISFISYKLDFNSLSIEFKSNDIVFLSNIKDFFTCTIGLNSLTKYIFNILLNKITSLFYYLYKSKDLYINSINRINNNKNIIVIII